ncbi:MAG: branched-chain amino acid ABC transporter permease [Deinococcales bacterium]
MSQDPNNTKLQHEIQGQRLLKSKLSPSYHYLMWALGLAIVLALILAPLWLKSYGLILLCTWAFRTIAVQGLNLTMGYAGQVSLAQAAFMGVGAYTSTLLIMKAGYNYWLALLIAMLLSLLIGFLIGFPALRIKEGHYLAFVTLGFGNLIWLVLRNEQWLTNGPLGIRDIPRPSIFGYSLFEPVKFYYFSLAMLALSSLIVWFILRSPWGRAFKALRDNAARSESLGLSKTTYTLLAFAIGSALAGVAGVMQAGLVEYIDPDSFLLWRSLLLVMMLVVGGSGSLIGPFIGAALVTLLPEWLRFTGEYYLVIFGIGVIIVMRYFPKGIAGFLPYLKRRFFTKEVQA